MQEAAQATLSTPVLLLIAATAIAALLVLIIRLRLHPFFALVIVSLCTALGTGIPVPRLLPTLLDAFGSTLGSVALLIGFGAVLGRVVAVTGGARVLADTLIARFGRARAPLGLAIACLLFGFPIFLDAAFVVMLPIIYSLARELRVSLLVLGMAAAGAFLVMHALVPPHPGPVAAAVFLNADVGLVLLVALLVGLPTWYVMGYRLAHFVSARQPFQEVPDLMGDDRSAAVTDPPAFAVVLFVLLLPLALIFMHTGLATLIKTDVLSENNTLLQILLLVGETPIAMLISTCVAIYLLLMRGQASGGLERASNVIDNALSPVCSIILITGAGGMFGGVLIASGIGDALAGSLKDVGLPLLVAAYVIAAALRIAQGSATVAGTTAASIMAGAVAGADIDAIQTAAIVVAIGAGAIGYSHVNDSGFWLVSRFLGVDTATMLKSWTVISTGISLMAFGLCWGLYVLA
ncbi:GntP family permease [Salinisphaera sp. Q1T1-3]|uniref:GntP family permease n=1 Tax=Salinisphaera sp. Q1T1-3 TaxID=2321229 RepID=UPI000E72DAE2|nr:GntP family permease [Salinisphaera sp. Q1T1-3]RJS91937.1 GntP family permease [Salinisphaera sp. Q1T1-3]